MATTHALVGLAVTTPLVVGVVLGGVLFALAELGTAEAGAAALIYRAVSFWAPLLPGGLAAGELLLGPEDR